MVVLCIIFPRFASDNIPSGGKIGDRELQLFFSQHIAGFYKKPLHF